ncbi:CDP-alcohol phosphatidyltransferase family protein [Pedobacter antarcticus]|uniref:CDP-alcohol phosphatidyltransferase n=2 Tax=Pedobacter antarcticus TaxID=34086 RepID=A0A081PBB5_9SPHI|nr:CDP-alcohol phosphatidyltransferase family protein [Pedobacter antarcticus]KEQ27988.1 CDP-alcohol phosphatidyltransferase [Pedobacter antarcticus 4BY]SDL71734.1 CDP-alcohol phosphatidyltransferase [Pedobacter antarcticus]SFE86669.1 CDP-alcohol phosphatidyltransferase [Pedobacter antarcticus]
MKAQQIPPVQPDVSFESTLKSNDTEEKIDIYFYRPIGYRIALLCAKLGITPNAVTIISIFFGVGAGILFYFPELWLNVIGMLLLVFANSLDSADGQLARITNNKSRLGRILDGFAGDFWFTSIHIALCLRLMDAGWPAWVWVLGIGAGVSHIFQSAMADYYRNIHLYFIKGVSGSELDNSADLQKEYDLNKANTNFFLNFVARGYMGYTRLQENCSPKLQRLLALMKSKFDMKIPAQELQAFNAQNKPLMRLTNIIQFNTRVIFLFLWLFIDQTWLYFVFDLLVLNTILIYMVRRQEKISGNFYQRLSAIA